MPNYNLTFTYLTPPPQGLRKSIASQVSPVPPLPPGNRAILNVRTSWLQEQWSAQSGAIVASRLATPVPLQTGPVSHREALGWPGDAWSAQRGAIVGAQLATPVPPVPIPVQVYSSLHLEGRSWPQESWKSQGGSSVASFTGGTGPVITTTLHDYNLGLSLMTLGGFRL